MEIKSPTLRSAISQVEQERSHVSTELTAFEEFRESVRLAMIGPAATAANSSESTEYLLEAYKEVVMDEVDYANVYGDSIGESLKKELSPTIADVLLSEEPLTQRRKRDLLRKTTLAIERREKFLKELDEERAALKSFDGKIADFESSAEKLPKCSIQKQSLEKLIKIWGKYDDLIDRGEGLIERRQDQIRDEERIQILGNCHALNEYLYSELQTSYPVLSVLADSLKQINSKRQKIEPHVA